MLYNEYAPVALTKGYLRMNNKEDRNTVIVKDASLELIFAAELFSKLNAEHRAQVISLIKDLLSLG